jgi:quinol-cytochrome oxidoreductase complex cytochrome b subunit
MLRRFGDWLDARLGHRRVCAAFRERVLPNGPSWWYTSASCLFWLLVIQGVTGLLLMATYSPSMTSAWASVHFIDQSAAGRFLRGVHHFAAHR